MVRLSLPVQETCGTATSRPPLMAKGLRWGMTSCSLKIITISMCRPQTATPYIHLSKNGPSPMMIYGFLESVQQSQAGTTYQHQTSRRQSSPAIAIAKSRGIWIHRRDSWPSGQPGRFEVDYNGEILFIDVATGCLTRGREHDTWGGNGPTA
jgi:hypothetical protein